MINRRLILGLFAVIVVLVGVVAADDGMPRCQLAHSFDVCHASLH